MLQGIRAHRSIRRYRPDPVSEELLAEVLGAGVRASTSGNIQPYTIVAVRDQERRERLCDLHFGQEMVRAAPVLLTFCADWHRMSAWCKERDARPGFMNFHAFMVGAIDAAIAAQTVALAAEAKGLGICFLGTTLAAAGDIADLLRCPEGVVPITSLVVGWPAEDPAPRDRLPLDAVVHQERYRPVDSGFLDDAYREKEVAGWERYMAIPELAARVRELGCENLAQVYTRAKYTKEGLEKRSRELLATLARQGFLPAPDAIS